MDGEQLNRDRRHRYRDLHSASHEKQMRFLARVPLAASRPRCSSAPTAPRGSPWPGVNRLSSGRWSAANRSTMLQLTMVHFRQ